MEHVLTGSKSQSVYKPSFADRLQTWLPKIVLAPTMLVTVVCIYGYIFWTAALSMTNSRFLPSFNFVGFTQYEKLMDNDRWISRSVCQIPENA